MSFFKSKDNYYMLALLLLVGKGATLGFGIAESLVCIALISLEAYNRYIAQTNKINEDKNSNLGKELQDKLASLESKFGLMNVRK
jgi:hypothetical protein